MPIHLLHGDAKSPDPFLIREKLDRLLKDVPREGNLNFSVFDLSETGTTIFDVVSSALTVPFLGGQRVVVAKGVKAVERFFKKPDEDETREEDLGAGGETIVRAVEQLGDLPDNALLIFVEENGHLDGRTAFYRALKKVGCVIDESKAMWFDAAAGDTDNAVKFIQAEAGRLGIRIDGDAAERFATLVGSDKGSILQELRKLSIYAGPGASPTREDVEKVVTESYEAGIFHLVDVIGLRRTGEAMEVLSDLMDRGAAPPYILAMIARQVRIIGQVRELLESGVPPGDVAKVLKESPFVIRKVLGQVRIFPEFDYARILDQLMETDVHLKRGTMPAKLALETLIARLAVGGPPLQRSGEAEAPGGSEYHPRRGRSV